MYSDALPDLKLSFDTVFYYVNDMNRRSPSMGKRWDYQCSRLISWRAST